MFGYIQPAVPELRVKEHELYRAFYCGLCRTMNVKTTCFSSLTLSYDFVFLALIRTVLEDSDTEFADGRCAAHPLKKRSYIKRNQVLEYCASAASVLTRGKVLDDINDSRGIKRLRGYLLLPAATLMEKKGKADPELIGAVYGGLDELSELERKYSESGREISADAPAEIFGRLLGTLCSHGIADEKNRRIAYEIGFHTGKWIYFIDAADDFEDDIKSGSFNPYKTVSSADGLSCERLRVSLLMELRGIEAAVGLMDFGERFVSVENIIKNIIYLGMPQCAERIIAEKNGTADNK